MPVLTVALLGLLSVTAARSYDHACTEVQRTLSPEERRRLRDDLDAEHREYLDTRSALQAVSREFVSERQTALWEWYWSEWEAMRVPMYEARFSGVEGELERYEQAYRDLNAAHRELLAALRVSAGVALREDMAIVSGIYQRRRREVYCGNDFGDSRNVVPPGLADPAPMDLAVDGFRDIEQVKAREEELRGQMQVWAEEIEDLADEAVALIGPDDASPVVDAIAKRTAVEMADMLVGAATGEYFGQRIEHRLQQSGYSGSHSLQQIYEANQALGARIGAAKAFYNVFMTGIESVLENTKVDDKVRIINRVHEIKDNIDAAEQEIQEGRAKIEEIRRKAGGNIDTGPGGS